MPKKQETRPANRQYQEFDIVKFVGYLNALYVIHMRSNNFLVSQGISKRSADGETQKSRSLKTGSGITLVLVAQPET